MRSTTRWTLSRYRWPRAIRRFSGRSTRATRYAVTAICDVRSQAVENATKLGTLVIAAAGNGGDIGAKVPTQNSLNTPGVAPSAFTVGASTNRHVLYQTVRVNGSSLGNLRGLFGDGPKSARH